MAPAHRCAQVPSSGPVTSPGATDTYSRAGSCGTCDAPSTTTAARERVRSAAKCASSSAIHRSHRSRSAGPSRSTPRAKRICRGAVTKALQASHRAAARRADPTPSTTSTGATGTETTAPGASASQSHRAYRPGRPAANGSSTSAANRANQPSRSDQPASTSSTCTTAAPGRYAVSRAAKVVLPEPAGPSTATTRTPPHDGGRPQSVVARSAYRRTSSGRDLPNSTASGC